MLKDRFEYIAKGPVDAPAKKLVILLHGYGVNAAYMEKMADSVLEQMPGACVIMPQAPDIMDLPDEDNREGLAVPPPDEAKSPPEGLAADAQREWFAITNSPLEMHAELLRLAGDMNKFIDAQRNALGLGDADIAIMGFSQGGALALYTAYTREQKIGCVVGHSTIIVKTEGFTQNVPTFLIYGTEDKSFPLAQYQAYTLKPLKAYLKELEIQEVQGLGHRTSDESRKACAAYITAQMKS